MRSVVLALGLLLWPISALEGQAVLFRDAFEAQLFPWSSSSSDLKFSHPEGATLSVRAGSAEPGTVITLEPAADIDLPEGMSPIGSAWEVTTDPPLSYPAELVLPQERGPATLIAIVIVGGGFVAIELYDRAKERIRVLRSGRTTDKVQRVGYGNVAEITAFDLVPSATAELHEDVFADVEWKGIAQEVVLDWQDGDKDTKYPDASDTEATFVHNYSEPGLYEVEVKFDYPELGFDAYRRREIQIVAPSFLGTWSSTEGPIEFHNLGGSKVEGLYNSSQSGRIDATISGTRTLEGFWIETISNRECESEKLDSDGELTNNWGSIRLEFNQDLSQFCGQWSYCDDPLGGSWNGWREGSSSPDC